ncbi:hypothetical protein CIW69_16450 [Enterobacter cloacae]|nr:hypothetical protein CIW69_16450 [Enterobacter cloacae]
MNLALSVHKQIVMAGIISALTPCYLLADCQVNHSQIVRLSLPDITLTGQEGTGSVLATGAVSLSGNMPKLSCDNGGELQALATHPVLSGKHIFATGIPGIGYKITINNNPFPWKADLHCSGTDCHANNPETAKAEMQIIQTSSAHPVAGYIREGVYGVLRPDKGKPALMFALAHRITVRRQACNTHIETVDLGHVSVKTFTGMFAQSQPTGFTLKLTCPDTMPVRMIWEGISDSHGFLRPFTGKQAVSGIGIKLNDNQGELLAPGKYYDLRENSAVMHFSASMIRTGTVTAGNVDAMATVHFMYD